MGTANGVNTLAKYVGGALGVGMLGSFVAASDSAGSTGAIQATPAMLAGFDRLFVAIGALAFVSLICTIWFPPGLRLKEGESFLTEIMSKGKVLYERDNRPVGAESRRRLPRLQHRLPQ